MPNADEIDAQLQHIAQMLREARAPLIYGLTQLTVEAQELAVELAMCLRGAIDTPRGSQIPPRGMSLQLHGEARTTFGELRQYADLLVFVGCEPWKERPDFAESWAIAGTRSLSKKTIFQICFKEPESADEGEALEVATNDPPPSFLNAEIWFRGEEFSTLVRELGCGDKQELRALRKKLAKVEPASNLPWEELLTAWQAAKYPVLVYDPEFFGPRSYLIEQLERAVLGRAKYGRAAAWPLDKTTDHLRNTCGAEYVLIARTGYPCAVRFFSGAAEYLPGVSDAYTIFTQKVCDVVLNLGEWIAPWWTEACYSTKQVLISSCSSPRSDFFKPLIYLPCRSLEHETSGTIVREDGVPFSLPLSEEAKKSWSLSVESLSKLEPAEELADADRVSDENSKTAPHMEDLLRRLLELVREPALAEQGAAR